MVAQRAFGVQSPSRVGLGLIVVAAVACSSTPPEGTGRNAQALNGSLTISGEINDATGLPLGSTVVQLLGPSDDGDDGDTDDAPLSIVQTAADGTFSFSGLSPGSYRVMPKRKHCRFDPRDVALTLVGSAAVDFQGAGPGCGGTPTVNFGAMQGPLTLSGHVLDGAGNGVVGARIELTGHGYGQEHPAVRYSDLMGGYAFHVGPGSYELTASADCVLNPSEIKLHHLAVDRTQDFEAVSSGCMSASVTNRNPTGTAFAISQAGQALGMVFVDLEQRASLAAAMTRLQQIISEQPNPVRSLTIAGYPAIERQMPNPVDPEPVISGVSDGGGPSTPTISLTGAIAAGSTIVRFESQLIATVSPTTVGAIFQVDRGFRDSIISILAGPPNPVGPSTHIFPAGSGSPAPTRSFTSSLVADSTGELQIAASDATSPIVVYATPNAAFFSNDGGQTVSQSALNFVSPPSFTISLFGDPSIAVAGPNAQGAQGFWYSLIQQSGGTTKAPLFAIGLYKSTDGGQTFSAAPTPFPVNYASAGSGALTTPDQPMLASDRVRRTANGRDILYLAWRQFAGGTPNGMAVACSSDETTWNIDTTTFAQTGADFGRLSVAPDGSLLVAYQIQSSDGHYRIWVHKFASCASPSPLQPQTQAGFPVEVPLPFFTSNLTRVPDLVGLDRQPIANHSIAADTDPTTGRVFVAYVNESKPGSDDVHVAEATGLGATWINDTVVNTTSQGSRFFPWVCTTAGRTFVTWYDRRHATTASPDLTAYYRTSVVDKGNGLTPSEEVDVSGVDDAECSAGFPAGARGSNEEKGCPTSELPGSPSNPLNAGQCTGNGPRCDQRFPNCPAGQTCGRGGNGQPTFGDYNGNACASGQLFMAWASTTPPADLSCTAIGRACSHPFDCCPGSSCVAGVCAPPALGGATGACSPTLGTSCSAGSNCCTGVCTSGVCACLANGTSCTTSASCCSDNCEAGQCLPAVEIYDNSAATCQGQACGQGQACTGAGCCSATSACNQVCCGPPVPACAGGECCTQAGACGSAGCCDPGVCVHGPTGPTCCSTESVCGNLCCDAPGSCTHAVPLLGPSCGCGAPNIVCTNVAPDGTKTTECCENDAQVHYTCMTFEPALDGSGGGNHCCDEAHSCGSLCCPYEDTCVVDATGPHCQSPSGVLQ